MHPSALDNGRRFFDCYAAGRAPGLSIVEIGAQDINGSLRALAPRGSHYTGIDFVAGPGVDLVLTDPYILPLPNESVDLVLSSSCFEHVGMFWLTFLEILRVLKPGGLFYLNAPSNGDFHRYPVDCWRFYPDSGRALIEWARRNGYRSVLLESFISAQMNDIWSDFVAVFLRDEGYVDHFPNRILSGRDDITNGLVHGNDILLRFETRPEDLRKLDEVSIQLSQSAPVSFA